MNFRIINRDNKDIDEFKDMNLLWIAVLFWEKVHISNNFRVYLDFENYLSSIRADSEARLRFQKYYNKFSSGPQNDEWFDTWLFNLHKYKTEKHKSGALLLWYMNCKKVIEGLDEIQITSTRKHLANRRLKEIIELNSEEETVFFSTSIAFPNMQPAKRKFDELEEYRFLSGIIKDNDAITILDRSVKNTSIFSGAFNPEDYDGRIMISEKPLFTIPLAVNLKKDQLKFVREDFLSSSLCLYDFFRDFNAGFQQNESARLNECRKLLVNQLFENSFKIQKMIDNNLYMIHMKNSQPESDENKIHLGICSKDNLIRAYRELKILDESVELSLREQVFRDIDLKQCVAFLMADYDPNWWG